MAPKPKAKRSATSHTASPLQGAVLTKGDWIDVMDQDGVWNVARVLSVPSPDEVEVMYDGWPEEYDDIVRVDSDRVAPYHTFTWAVKCWVKYLNWPLWPSLITIRTPGTAEGIKNLAMENRLYVDFLDNPNFAERDRCWQKKRQVKIFDDNYDKNRTGTNGAQFEQALEFVLRSDSTTKMPTFARGTLPLQYEHSTTESVERMRKTMGNSFWYRNFANSKERHVQTHIYEMLGGDDEDSASDDSMPVPKLQVQRPKTSTTQEKKMSSPQNKKRPFSAKKQPVSVKIEQEPLAHGEIPYRLEEMASSDGQESECERKVALTKKRRLQTKRRSTASVVEKSELSAKRGKHSSSQDDTTAAPAISRHVMIMRDEIIVDDEDSEDAQIGRKRKAKNTGTSSRKLSAGNTPTRKKKSSEADDLLSFSGSEASISTDIAQKLKTKVTTTGRTRQQVLRRNSEGLLKLPRTGSSLSSAEESDDSRLSDGFDPGIASEGKTSSPFDSQVNFQDSSTTSLSGITFKSTERPKVNADNDMVLSGASVAALSTKTKNKDKEQTKMAARRSIPPLSEAISLAVSSKTRSSIRFTRSLSDEDAGQDEEKGFLRNVKAVKRHEMLFDKSVIRRHSKQSEDHQRDIEPGAVAASHTPRQSKSSNRPKTPLPLIEKRITFAKEVLRDLDKEKQEAIKVIAPKERQKRSTIPSLSGSDSGPQATPPRAKIPKPRPYQQQNSGPTFLRIDDKENRLSAISVIASDCQGGMPETPLDFGLHSNELGHSFLAVDEAYSSDTQESKGVPVLFEDVTRDVHNDPNESRSGKKAEAKSLVEMKIVASAKQVAEEKPNDRVDVEEKSQDVRRRFCVMQAGSEDTLEVDDDEKAQAKSCKKTVVSVPRKFGEGVKEAAYVYTSLTDSMLLIAPPPPLSLPDSDDHVNVTLTSPSTRVFSSSEGFSMDKWFKRALTAQYRSSKA